VPSSRAPRLTSRGRWTRTVTCESQVLNLATVDIKDLLAFRQALTRRSITLDVADIVAFEAHEEWADLLLECTQVEQVPGYARVSLEQALRADKELWQRIAGSCRDGVRRTAIGARPVELAIQVWRFGPMLRVFLAPLPTRGSSSSSDAPPKELKRFALDVERLQRDLKSQKTGNGGKGGGGGSGAPPDKKGTGKGNRAKKSRQPDGREPTTLPRELAGKNLIWRGFYWDYNSKKGCNRAKAGGSCEKGAHSCMYPDCAGSHPAVNHR